MLSRYYSLDDWGGLDSQMLSISRKCCRPVTELLPKYEQLLQGKGAILMVRQAHHGGLSKGEPLGGALAYAAFDAPCSR